jgi:uncharacterized protein YbaP (TraB family)
MTDGEGRPVRFRLTGGQVADCSEALPVDVFNKLEADYSTTGIQVENMPAWLMTTVLTMLDMDIAGLSALFATESKLQKLWGTRPTKGRESAEEQIAAMSSLDDNIQREMLVSYLSTPLKERLELFQTLHQLWQSGDTEALNDWHDKTNEKWYSPEIIQKFNEVLLYSRNKRFIERLSPQLTHGKPVFVAVGAAHLGGDKGVLALLRVKGYKITAR